jgi:capsular exopolysaccharide synthesis family protein
MSRIQDILNKAERDGTTRRTRSLVDEYPPAPPDEPVIARSPHEPAHTVTAPEVPSVGRFSDEPPVRPPELPRPPRTAGAGPHVDRQLRNESAADASPAPEPRRFPEGLVDAPEQPNAAADPAARARAELDHLLVAALAPASIAAEQYRALRTRLKRAESGRSSRVVAITSPVKGDGKSLTSANLALTMAQELQQRVLLVDGDLRRPAIHRLFGLAGGSGLGDVLMNRADLDQALVFLPEHHLTVLHAGVPPAHPAELLGSATMRRVLDTLRTRFDRILIDVPPVAPLADLHILAPMVDGLLMIVRAGVTPKPAIERALASLDASKVLGLVLNESGNEPADTNDYEGYGYLAG